MSLVLDGSSGVQYPTGSNYQVPALNMPSGSVIQIINAYTTSTTSTTSNSYVATALTATITPQFSTSKIFVSYVATIDNNNGAQMNVTVFRNGTTDLSTGSGSRGFNEFFTAGGEWEGVSSAQILDSPATTSATTYTIYIRANSGSHQMYLNQNPTQSSITLMEIR